MLITLRCSGRGYATGQLAGLYHRRLGWRPFWAIVAAPLSSTVRPAPDVVRRPQEQVRGRCR